jgi:hypothetical protein
MWFMDGSFVEINMSENGVTLALEAAREKMPGVNAYKALADILTQNGAPCTYNAIHRFEEKACFPVERARVIARELDLPLIKLVHPKYAPLINAA